MFKSFKSRFFARLRDSLIKNCSEECYFAKICQKYADEIHLSLDDVFLPKIATENSAGADFFTPVEIYLEPGEEMKIATGIKAHMAKWTRLSIVPKSGLGFKYFVRIANTIGTIDGDYWENPDNDGCIFVKIRNEGNKPMYIKKGESFCQGIFEFYIPDRDYFKASKKTRGGGLGSTDAKAEK